MNGLTELERAQKVVADFVPQDPPGEYYVYAYLGKATLDATAYEIIDGLCLASERIWHLDESQADCVAYVGEGTNGRINTYQQHPFVPTNKECRIKLYEGASKTDAQELERLLINELGCILDDARDDGCLANIRYFNNGPYCCRRLEASVYRNTLRLKANAAGFAVNTYAMFSDKTIIAAGSMKGLARKFGFHDTAISSCCSGKQSGIWSFQFNLAVYFCRADDYDNYEIKPMPNNNCTRRRILVAAKLDGSDICCGTTAEISAHAPEIKHTSDLHRVARGQRAHAYGWIAKYADEFEECVTEYVPTLSAFF